MKKILNLLPVFFLFASTSLFAQPTFKFDSKEVKPGDEFCITVKTQDFTDILSVQKDIRWDPNVIRFVRIQNENLKDLDASDFDLTDVSTGRLHWDWMDEDVSGVTVPASMEDTYVLFEICFESIGSFGKSTQIDVPDTPVPFVTRTGTGGINIGCFTEPGLIGTCVYPVKFILNNPEPNQGDLFCVDVAVENFREIGSMQFTIEYDPAVLEPDGIGISNYAIPGFNPLGNTAIPQPGRITLSFFNLMGPQSLPDGTNAFGICFRAIGDCDDYSFVRITSDLTPLIVTSGEEPPPAVGINIGAVVCDGLVRIAPCNQTGGVTISTDCPNAKPGDIVCVEVAADGFDDLTEADFLIKFNPTVLRYVSSSFPTPFQATLDPSAANLGTLSVKWRSRTPTAGLTVADGTDIIELCFEVIGDGTVSSSISFTGNPEAFFSVKGSSSNVGMIADNGCVIVEAPPGLTLSAGDYEGFKGEEVCVDVTVANFAELTEAAFSINYAGNVVQFDRVENINVPNMTAANFTDLSSGNIGVNWTAGAASLGESLDNGDVAFTLCFTIIGDPTMPPSLPNCSIIEFSGDPVPINIFSAASGTNITLNSNPGNICVKDPGAFTVIGSDEVGGLGDRVCVDVSVVNCNEITSFQFSSNWNSGPLAPVVEYDGIEVTGAIPGFTVSNFDETNTPLGILTTSWSGGPITLADDTPIFRVCFNIIGNPNDCTDFAFDEQPLPVYVTSTLSGGNDIGLTSENGSICANDYLHIREGIVTHIECLNGAGGSVFLNMGGGVIPYNFTWSGGTPGNTNNVSNLDEGTYTVTVTDSSVPPFEVIDSFEVVYSGTAPVAEAGESVSMNCNSLPVILDGSSSSGGNNIRYQWTTVDGGLVSPSDRSTEPRVTAPGTYVLEVINTSTNCSSFDTVIVTPPISEEGADAGPDVFLTCYEPEVLLDGSNSVGNNLKYTWVSLNTGLLEQGTDSLAIATALSAGDFELTVLNKQSGCEGKDTVRVGAGNFPPIVDAGPQMSIPCQADTVTIGGTGTSTGPGFIHEWSEVGGGNIVGDRDMPSADVNSAGTYQLIVIDTLNGCSDTATVEVIGDPNRPVSDAGDDLSLTCNDPSLQLQSQNSSQGAQFEYTWTTVGSGVIQPGEEHILQPTVSEPGLYQLMVKNTVTGCESIANVAVSSFKSQPVATAGVDFEFQCDVQQIQLDGTGSSESTMNPDLYQYTWSNDNPDAVLGQADLLVTTGFGTGEYILEVLNTENGCVAYDTMVVTQDTVSSKPIIQMHTPNKKFTCINDEVTLNAIGSDSGSDFQVVWGPSSNIASGQGTLTPTVTVPGTYTLSIVNDTSACFTTETVEVLEDKVPPLAIVSSDSIQLPCDPAQVRLSALGSSTGNGFQLEWSHREPGAINNPNLVQPTVTEVGVYTLIVTNLNNGCTSDTSLLVYPAPSNIVADAGTDLILNCIDEEFNITGGNSSVGTDFTYEWINKATQQVVSNDLAWTVQDSGTYILTIMDNMGCLKTDEVRVDENKNIPTVNAGRDSTYRCFFENAVLNGTADGGGANLTIEWTSPDGNPITDAGTLNPTVTEPGVYIMTVENEDNGCMASAQIEIILDNANLEGATADYDVEMCDDFAMLTANLPTGATGLWTAPNGISFDDATDPMTIANNLPSGTTQLIWTLSTDDCPDYSSANVDVEISGAGSSLILRNDVIRMDGDSTVVEVEFTRNDNIDPDGNWTVTLLDTPPTGTLTMLTDESFSYEKEIGYSGTFELTYEVCNLDCPDQCDTAYIQIKVEPKVIEPGETPNAITPNGDGLNDELVFDEITFATEELPDNELTVFNRWGDIVYKAKPYNNDWQGTGRGGKVLPQATYYYILRLNVAEGLIIRGDVTILK